jgi:hypothetical protein
MEVLLAIELVLILGLALKVRSRDIERELRRRPLGYVRLQKPFDGADQWCALSNVRSVAHPNPSCGGFGQDRGGRAR